MRDQLPCQLADVCCTLDKREHCRVDQPTAAIEVDYIGRNAHSRLFEALVVYSIAPCVLPRQLGHSPTVLDFTVCVAIRCDLSRLNVDGIQIAKHSVCSNTCTFLPCIHFLKNNVQFSSSNCKNMFYLGAALTTWLPRWLVCQDQRADAADSLATRHSILDGLLITFV